LNSESNAANVRDFGALGDGCTDDFPAFQRALDSGAATVTVPPGIYRVTKTLRVRSNTAVEAHHNARIVLCGDTPKKRGDFLLTNFDHAGGNVNIRISGGVWDGDNGSPCNLRGERYGADSFSGIPVNFCNVRGLTLANMVVANPDAYYIRLSQLDGFTIENLAFVSDRMTRNQDGLHFNGNVRNGTVRNITALSNGQPNDDMIALNADDCYDRCECHDVYAGPIENISFENITAQNCHTLIRILSITAPVRNITFKNVQAGCRCYALNMDAARYCAAPIFREEDVPDGVGNAENIRIEGMTVHFTRDKSPDAMVAPETNVKNLRIRGFKYNHGLNKSPESPALTARNIVGATIRADGKAYDTLGKRDVLNLADFVDLDVN